MKTEAEENSEDIEFLNLAFENKDTPKNKYTGIFKDIIVTYYNYFMEKEIDEFKKALHKDSVKFKYRKKNGEEREAFGTLNIDIMGEENAPSGNGKEYPENQIRYFDLVSNGWRSFLSENLISWENG